VTTGTGTSHLLLGLAWPPASAAAGACSATPPRWSTSWPVAAGDPILTCTVARYPAACDLRCLDELGDLHWTATAPNCCLQVLTEHSGNGLDRGRPQRPLQPVGPRSPADPRLAATIVDRRTCNALIIETGNQSSRLRATRSPNNGVAQAG
jgi:hypothetical protein